MITTPNYLKKGDTIGIVCPAGFMALEKVQACIDVLQQWGYVVRLGKTVGGASQNYFSGSDNERLDDFQQMLDDEDIKAILCARGGYGVGRIIDDINFKKFKKKPKWIIGFSDITVLHSHIHTNYKTATLHAPMASAFNEGEDKNEFVQSLKNALEGKRIKYSCPAHEMNQKGEAIGSLVGGNLSLLTNLIGTSSDIKTKNKILFLEDIGEYLYQVDRMLYQLKRNGKFESLAGLIIGGFTDMKDTERPFGKSIYEIVKELLKEYDYPICFDFPVSHAKENYALKVGIGYRFKVGKSTVTLEE